MLATTTTQLARVVLMVRSPTAMAAALEFYTAGLGLHAARVTDEWAELRSASNCSVCLQVVTSEAQASTGYSPLLQFQVSDMDHSIAKCVQLGGHLDGPIQYPAHGKMAALRSPDGHMIGVYEPAVSSGGGGGTS